MWIVSAIQSRAVTLDFTSSGQGTRPARQVLFDDTTFANAVDLTGWSADRFQPLVCESCGCEGCAVGNWLVARRTGGIATFLPAFDAMEEMVRERTDLGTPAYARKRGAPVLGEELYAELVNLLPKLPAFDELGPLTRGEVARLAQWEAPAAVLGRFPATPRVRRGVIDAVSDGLLTEQLDELSRLLAEFAGDAGSVELVSAEGLEAIEFYLGTSPIMTWRPLVERCGASGLRLEPGLAVVAGP